MRTVAFWTIVLAVVTGVGAQEAIRPLDPATIDTYWRIRREATANSQILKTVHMLTDVHGPRLTGSPNVKAAAEWAVERMTEWGLENGRLEPWAFGHPGWANERLSAHIVAPVKDHLVVEALAWTPGTDGPIRAHATHLIVPAQPTKDTLSAHLEQSRSAMRGKVVLVGAPQRIPVAFTASPLRRDDRELLAQFDPAIVPSAATPPPPSSPRPGVLTATQLDEHVNRFLLESGALVRVNDAGRDHSQIRAFANRSYDPATAPPTVVMRNEDYGRISRLLESGRSVELEFDVVNRTFPEGRTSYNAVAEIPGSDKADEVVMLGAHLDSWHAATGATDNAAGCAVMMEAARILSAIGVKPRRTIRVALWSGEEQGLLGSQAYVREHFGTFDQPRAEYAKFGGYFNVDSGTGRIRGLTVFGPPAAAAVLRAAMGPLADLGVVGTTTTRSRQRGGTDSTSFNEVGLPGISTQLDPIQYNSHTWHTNLDTYERIVEDDLKSSAIVIAAGIYYLATREELLPRFPPEEMPASPGARPTTTSGAAR
jgi:hypothetical protein